MNEGPIYNKSFEFALKVVSLYQQLVAQKEFVLSKQLLRCGTSIGANVNEASAGKSKKDFISKMAIASKEARETLYWLRLLKESKIAQIDYTDYISRCEELVRILTAIVKTSQAGQ